MTLSNNCLPVSPFTAVKPYAEVSRGMSATVSFLSIVPVLNNTSIAVASSASKILIVLFDHKMQPVAANTVRSAVWPNIFESRGKRLPFWLYLCNLRFISLWEMQQGQEEVMTLRRKTSDGYIDFILPEQYVDGDNAESQHHFVALNGDVE